MKRGNLPQHARTAIIVGPLRPLWNAMYRPNRLKQRLRNGENVLGCWTMLGHPLVVEILSLAVEGIDLLFIPFDLSATVGQMGNLKHPEVARLIAHAESRIRAAGGPMGTVPHPGLTPQDMFERGYQFVNAGSDIAHLRDRALADVKAFRARYRET
jgi:2-keto-3-deoxy-L-rhamnonate aldolase RhmA